MIAGAAPIGMALARVAAAAGYQVAAGSGADAPPIEGAAAVVVASHGADEEQVLANALIAGVPYVALVASSRRGEAVRESLGVPAELRAQLHTPAGLELGARTPDEIAVAILAEIIAESHAHPVAGVGATPVASAVDPVCGMEVAVTEATACLDLDGARVYFCSARLPRRVRRGACRRADRSPPASCSPPAARSASAGPSSCCRSVPGRCSTTCSAWRATPRSTS